MKKLLIVLMCMCVLAGCSNKKKVPEKQEVKQEVKEEGVDYTGTWNCAKFVDENGTEWLVEDDSELSEFAMFVLKGDNTDYFSIGNNSGVGNWGISNDGIIMGSIKIPFEDGQLIIEDNGSILYLEKTSESEEFPKTEVTVQEPVEEKAEVKEETEVVEETVYSGLRPEFKEAMDAYEKFYTDYCEFMKQYSKNPSDLTLLAKYATMISDLDKMDKKFESWESEDLNAEELAYYIDVNARIQKMMLEALQ